MFVHPANILICRLIGTRGTHTKGNALGQLAGASTFWLIFCLPVAYALSRQNPSWFFMAILLIIGGCCSYAMTVEVDPRQSKSQGVVALLFPI